MPRHGRWVLLAVVSCISLGASIRLVHLDRQVLGGDETHSPRTAAGQSIRQVLTSYGVADHCLPMTALVRAGLDRGNEFDETDLRGLPVAAGLLLLGLVPALLWRRLSPAVLVVLALAMALSPGLVIYSRIARPYSPTILLACGAIFLFYRWWTRGRTADGVGYAGLAALAGWFHLGAIPMVLAPWILWVLDYRRARWFAGLAVLALVVMGYVAFLAPAWESFQSSVQSKARSGAGLNLDTVRGTAQLMAGSRSFALAIVFWTLAGWGWGVWWRRSRRAAGFTAVVVATHLAGVAILSPQGISHPVAMHRYVVFLTPLVLLWWSMGIAHLAGGPAWSKGVAVVGVMASLLAHPLLDPGWHRSTFTAHHSVVGFHDPPPRVEKLPALYDVVLADERPGRVIEAPWSHLWTAHLTTPAYQRLHGRPVMVATFSQSLRHPSYRWDNMVSMELARLLEADARWLVVHRDLALEEMALREPGTQLWERLPSDWRVMKLRVGSWVELAEAHWGPAVTEDDTGWVWDLDAVRLRGH